MGVQKKTRKFAQVKRVIGMIHFSIICRVPANSYRPARCPPVCDHAPITHTEHMLIHCTGRRTKWPARSRLRRKNKNPKPSAKCTSPATSNHPSHNLSNQQLQALKSPPLFSSKPTPPLGPPTPFSSTPTSSLTPYTPSSSSTKPSWTCFTRKPRPSSQPA